HSRRSHPRPPPPFPTRRSSDLDPHLLAQLGVEVGEWFVEQQDVGFEDDAASERHALLLPTRELARSAARHRRETDEVEDLAYPPDRKSTRLNSSHVKISYAVFC